MREDRRDRPGLPDGPKLRRLRRRCEARLRELELPDPFDVGTFCDTLGARRGRPICLRPVIIRAGLCGVWVAGTTTDYIFFEQATSRLHQEHIILHEIGHILCGHRPTPLLDEEYSLLLLPDLDVEMVRRVLRRRSYSGDQEQEAELLASLILKPAGRAVLPIVRQAGSEVAALLERLEAVLDQPPRGSA